MTTPDEAELWAALAAALESERTARDQLIRARDELNERDARFGALEAELWSGWEEETARHEAEQAALRDEVAACRTETAALQAEIVRLRVRLSRIAGSPPIRVYARLQGLPGLRTVRARRARAYETAVRALRSE